MIQVSNRNYPNEVQMGHEQALEFGQQCSVELDYQFYDLSSGGGVGGYDLESVDADDLEGVVDDLNHLVDRLCALLDAAMDTRDGFQRAFELYEPEEEEED